MTEQRKVEKWLTLYEDDYIRLKRPWDDVEPYAVEAKGDEKLLDVLNITLGKEGGKWETIYEDRYVLLRRHKAEKRLYFLFVKYSQELDLIIADGVGFGL